MIILALDTCDPRGSVAVLRDADLVKAIPHEGPEDYSTWLLPAAEQALQASALSIRDVELLAVASGPGSFTGVRIALTTVKAWSEVHNQRITRVSRLEAIASRAATGAQTGYVAAFVDAHRDQVFGGLFRRDGPDLRTVETEMVAAPADFLHWVKQRSANQSVNWISMDPEKMTVQPVWRERAEAGETVERSTIVLAPAIGRIGLKGAMQGQFVDALALDADYIRRPDAELYWKGAGRGS